MADRIYNQVFSPETFHVLVSLDDFETVMRRSTPSVFTNACGIRKSLVSICCLRLFGRLVSTGITSQTQRRARGRLRTHTHSITLATKRIKSNVSRTTVITNNVIGNSGHIPDYLIYIWSETT